MKLIPKISFGLRQWALRQARKELKAEQQKVKDIFAPINPFEHTEVKQVNLSLSPTEQPKEHSIMIVKPISAMEAALNRLREQANKK